MSTTLTYLVPVDVEVDVSEQRIVRVTVRDEEACYVSSDEKGKQRRQQALKISESEGWPAWEFGN